MVEVAVILENLMLSVLHLEVATVFGSVVFFAVTKRLLAVYELCLLHQEQSTLGWITINDRSSHLGSSTQTELSTTKSASCSTPRIASILLWPPLRM